MIEFETTRSHTTVIVIYDRTESLICFGSPLTTDNHATDQAKREKPAFGKILVYL